MHDEVPLLRAAWKCGSTAAQGPLASFGPPEFSDAALPCKRPFRGLGGKGEERTRVGSMTHRTDPGSSREDQP